MNANITATLYLVSGVLFIMSLRGLSSPATSRKGNLYGMVGMAIAIVVTLLGAKPSFGSAILILAGLGIGGGISWSRPSTASSASPRCSWPPARSTRPTPSASARSATSTPARWSR